MPVVGYRGCRSIENGEKYGDIVSIILSERFFFFCLDNNLKVLDESIGNWELGIELINEEWKSLNISRIVEIKKCGDTCVMDWLIKIFVSRNSIFRFCFFLLDSEILKKK